MNNSNPTPLVRRRVTKTCPVCGQPSYSREGIHPQCSVEQAEQPQRERLAAEKRLEEKAKKKNPRKSWNKKCPKCKVEVHVRLAVCKCGHTF